MTPEDRILQLNQENAQLKQKVSELSEFIENASMPLHWVNGEGIIVWANKAELEFLGYEKEEYIGAKIQDFHQDQDTIAEILQLLGDNERVNDYPAVLKCKDGSLRHVIINSSALIKNGEFVHSMCFTKDVTAAMLAEERKNKLTVLLEEKEERLRLAMAATGLGTWDWDSESNMVYLSERSKDILGIGTDAIYADNLLDIVHVDDRSSVFEPVKQLSDSSSDGHFEFTGRIVKNHRYSTAWVKVQGAAYFSDGKRSRRIIGTIMDITDQKKAIAKSAEMAAIVNSSYDAIIGKTLAGIITSWNDAAEKLFGYRSSEIIGRSILTLIPEDRQQEEDYILAQMRRGESIKHFETVRRTKSGKLIDLSLTISPIKNEGGEIIGVSKIARDITEKKQEERRKNAFISMASHELKTPLTSVLLSAQLMQKHVEKFGQIGSTVGQKIEIQVKKMMGMIQDFLSMAEVEGGKLQLHKSCFQLASLMEECKHDFDTVSTNHKIEMTCDASIEIFADRNKIGQVLTNLLGNAIKYSSSGGTVTIGCKKVGNRVRIYVRDEGIGIDKHHQNKLFQPFYRVDNLNTTTISGFGIGLYLVAEILRSHNSRIQVESVKDKGSTFYFELLEHGCPKKGIL